MESFGTLMQSTESPRGEPINTTPSVWVAPGNGASPFSTVKREQIWAPPGTLGDQRRAPEALRAPSEAPLTNSPKDLAAQKQVATTHRSWGKGVLAFSAGAGWVYEVTSQIAASGSLGARLGWASAGGAVLGAATWQAFRDWWRGERKSKSDGD